jgi:hypothetical protein
MTLRLVTDESVENMPPVEVVVPVDVATDHAPPDLPHVCRKPEFNAMVDTCPACPAEDPKGVLAEAGEKPYRHVNPPPPDSRTLIRKNQISYHLWRILLAVARFWGHNGG